MRHIENKAPGKAYCEKLTIPDLARLFLDETVARAWFESARWEVRRCCPYCGSPRTTVILSGKPMPYHCTDCRQYFSVRIGTVLQSSKLPLKKWAIAIYLLSASLSGATGMNLYRDIGVTRKTATMMVQKIREGWHDGSWPLSGKVACAAPVSAKAKRPVGRPPKVIERIPASAQEILEAIFRAAGHKTAN